MDSKNHSAHPLGLHRVLDDPKVLPQNAQRLDPTPKICQNELLLDVETLQIDSASFQQLVTEYPDPADLQDAIAHIIHTRGKMQNPVTGSGGMLLGTVSQVGKSYPDQLSVGTRVATLVSLTATPLCLQSIKALEPALERVVVDAQAVLFERSLYAVLPEGVSEGAAVAAFDICGAPLLTVNHVKKDDTVFVLGLGKAGRSVISALRYRFGDDIKILGVDSYGAAVSECNRCDAGGIYDVVNATDPLHLMSWVRQNNNAQGADVTVNLVNVPNTEMPSVLATKDQGKVIFYSMATDFQKVTLGAESVAKDVSLIMGTGFTTGHADFMVELLRQDDQLLRYFEERFGGTN